MSATTAAIPHGTPSGYSYHGCRCIACKESESARARRKWGNPAYRAAAAARAREWALANPERAAATARRRRERNLSHFREMDRTRYERNKKSRQAQSRRTSEKRRRIPQYRRGAWSHAEDKFLLASPEMTDVERAYALGRSYQSVHAHRYRLLRGLLRPRGFCRSGEHKLTPENIYTTPAGRRRCRHCTARTARARRAAGKCQTTT